MTVWNKLPIGGGGGMVFTLLAHGGNDHGEATYTYTTTQHYDYVIASAFRTNGDPTLTCSGGTQVASFLYSVSSGTNKNGERVVIWKDVDSGAVLTYASVVNRRGYIFTGVNFG